MALKFRLKGLAETFLSQVTCPGCGASGNDDEHFHTDLTKVTFTGIVVVAGCRTCGSLFVPKNQRLGVVNPTALREAVIQDSEDTGEPVLEDLNAVAVCIEHMNAERSDTVQ